MAVPSKRVDRSILSFSHCLRRGSNLEVLAVNSHGGSSPPPRTTRSGLTRDRFPRQRREVGGLESQLAQQRAPAYWFPEQPPKYSSVVPPTPQAQFAQLQVFPSGSLPVAVQTLIGWSHGVPPLRVT